MKIREDFMCPDCKRRGTLEIVAEDDMAAWSVCGQCGHELLWPKAFSFEDHIMPILKPENKEET